MAEGQQCGSFVCLSSRLFSLPGDFPPPSPLPAHQVRQDGSDAQQRMQSSARTLLPLLVQMVSRWPDLAAPALAAVEVTQQPPPSPLPSTSLAASPPRKDPPPPPPEVLVLPPQALLWGFLPHQEWMLVVEHFAPELLAPILRRAWEAAPADPALAAPESEPGESPDEQAGQCSSPRP